MEPFVSGVILAAGSSSRMGQPKQLLPLGDRPMLQRVLDEALASSLDEIIVVLGAEAGEIRKAIRYPRGRRVRIVVNYDYVRGLSGSLRLGLSVANARAAAAAVLLGDLPQVRAWVIDRVTQAFFECGKAVVRPVYRTADGRRIPGHPVCLARRIWPEVKRLDGDQGARGLLTAHPEWVFEMIVEGDPPGDIDTPADYRNAELAFVAEPGARGPQSK